MGTYCLNPLRNTVKMKHMLTSTLRRSTVSLSRLKTLDATAHVGFTTDTTVLTSRLIIPIAHGIPLLNRDAVYKEGR
jgi:hypothetical protein